MMKFHHYKLHFNIHSYWHAGSGRGGGSLLDAVAHKDPGGLPYLPGRTIRGLLRDAIYRVEQWGYVPKNMTERLFGTEGPMAGVTRLETKEGLLAVTDAVLPAELSAWLSDPCNEEAVRLRQALFRHLSATAVEPETGCARTKSLRSIEVAVPMTLTACLEVLNPQVLDIINWGDSNNLKTCLERCLPLIRAVGVARSRGLGRVEVTLEEVCNKNASP